MYILPPFILQNFYKKILELIQSYEDMNHFWDQNSPFVLNKLFLVQTIITFIYLLALSLCKILKNSDMESRIMTMHHFLTQSGPFAPNSFFWKTITIILIYLLAPFIVQNFKKILAVDPEL